jgi:hypothetical protein
VSSLGLDLDVLMVNLESEWRQVYEGSIIARAEYQALAVRKTVNADLLDTARERLEQADALKAQIMLKIERLENRVLGRRC